LLVRKKSKGLGGEWSPDEECLSPPSEKCLGDGGGFEPSGHYLGQCIESLSLTHQPILLLAVCSTHMRPRFLNACARWNIWLVFVSAKTTWLLQPADTHCFTFFKRCLRQLYEKSLLASSDGVIDIKTIIIYLDRSTRAILQGKRWSAAFDANGWSWRQQLV